MEIGGTQQIQSLKKDTNKVIKETQTTVIYNKNSNLQTEKISQQLKQKPKLKSQTRHIMFLQVDITTKSFKKDFTKQKTYLPKPRNDFHIK